MQKNKSLILAAILVLIAFGSLSAADGLNVSDPARTSGADLNRILRDFQKIRSEF